MGRSTPSPLAPWRPAGFGLRAFLLPDAEKQGYVSVLRQSQPEGQVDQEDVKELWRHYRSTAMQVFRSRDHFTVEQLPKPLACMPADTAELEDLHRVTFIYETSISYKDGMKKWRVRSDIPPMILEGGTEQL